MLKRRPLIFALVVALMAAFAPSALAAPPANDPFSGRVDMTLNQHYSGDTTEATGPETNESIYDDGDDGGQGKTVWYQFVPPSATEQLYSFSTCTEQTETDTILQAFTGTSFPLTEIGENDEYSYSYCGEGPSVLTVRGDSSDTFKLQLDSWDGGDAGPYGLYVTQGGIPFLEARQVANGEGFEDGDTITTNSVEVLFASSAPEGEGPTVSTYECSLDGGAPAPCTAPKVFSNLANGNHRLDVIDQQNDEYAYIEFRVAVPAAKPPAQNPPVVTPQDKSFSGISSKSLPKSVTVSGGSAQFELLSPENATGTLSAKSTKAVAAQAAAKKKKGKKKKRKISLGKVNFTLLANQPKTVKLKLSKAARKVLRKKGKLKASVTISARDSAGNPKVTKKTVTFKAKKAKKKKRKKG